MDVEENIEKISILQRGFGRQLVVGNSSGNTAILVGQLKGIANI